MGVPSTGIASVSGSALVPSSGTIWPLRVTRPEVMISSAFRRRGGPAGAGVFWWGREKRKRGCQHRVRKGPQRTRRRVPQEHRQECLCHKSEAGGRRYKTKGNPRVAGPFGGLRVNVPGPYTGKKDGRSEDRPVHGRLFFGGGEAVVADAADFGAGDGYLHVEVAGDLFLELLVEAGIGRCV